MENVYIATTTLNFNNILSTESISPTSIYSKRGFGYKRFENVEPNNYDDIIIAYSKPPLFKITDDELDSYPLIIELSKDLVQGLENIGHHKSIDIFIISKTIYLHPNKVKFFFLNEEHKKISLIKAEPSISTKLIPLYFNNFNILFKNDCFDWDKSYMTHISKHNFENIQLHDVIFMDKQINSIKGFYYCYVLGELFSSLESQKKIYKLISDNNISRNTALKLKDYKKILEINLDENKILEKQHPILINNFKDILIAHYRITSIGENEQATLYKNILNDISQYAINNENDFKSEKFELLKTIGDNFKDWQDISVEEKNLIIDYIRSLLKNIKNYEPFDINSIEKNKFHVLLKSISLFILKGDDLEKLLNSLLENDLKTFKIAFGLWGATFGFAAIPKTLSNKLFESDLKDIINVEDFLNAVYKEIHKIDNTDPIIIHKHSKQKIETIDDLPLPNNIEQKNQEIPKCKHCGSTMIVQEANPEKNHKKAYVCPRYKSGCKGDWKDFQEYHINKSAISKEKPSSAFKTENLLSPTDTDNNDILYECLKDKKEMKISEVKKILRCKNNNQFKELLKNDSRFEIYNKDKSQMVKIKDS